MKKPFAYGLLLCLLSATVSAVEVHDEAFYQQHAINGLTVVDHSVDFLVLGDWGRNGHYAQRQVAEMMDVAMWQLSADFVVTTGDNFYSNGKGFSS